MITSEIKTITPEIANALLLKNVNNRPLNKSTVDNYAAQMVNGLWRLNGEPIIISENDTILDGQHRLQACIKSNKSIQTVIITGVPQDTFATIDTGRIRTAGDVFSIDGIANANQSSAAISKYFNFKKGAVRSIDQTSLVTLGISKQQILDFYKENKDIVNVIVKFASACYSKVRLLNHSAICAYMLYLVKDKNHTLAKVTDFFAELFGLQETTNTSVTVCRDALLRHLSRQRVLTPTIKTAYVIKAWNAYITGKNLQQISYSRERDLKIDFN